MDLSLGAVRYHLEALEEQGLVVSCRNGRRLHWYASSGLLAEDRVLISALRVRAQRLLLTALVHTGPSTFSNLERESNLAPRLVSRHLRLLTAAGLVTLDADRTYRLVNAERVARQLGALRLRFPDLLADAAREIFDGS